MKYRFCSICGGPIQKKGIHLACTNCPFVNYQNPRPTVSGILLYNGKLLLTRRGRDPFKGAWDFPGGFMEQNETPEEAIRREMKEETGLDVSVVKLVGIYPGFYPLKFDPVALLSIVYLLRSPHDRVVARDDVEEGKWFSLHRLPRRIAFNNHVRILRDVTRVLKSQD